MPFQTQALNELAATIAGATAAVSGKQTVGAPPTLDVQVVTADATLDPNAALVILDGSTNPVTLTLAPVATVERRQYLLIPISVAHPVIVQIDPGDAGIIFGVNLGTNGGTAFTVPAVGYAVMLIARVIAGLGNVWIPSNTTDARGGTIVQTRDTTGGDQVETLPPATANAGPLFCYKNSGTGTHTLTVNRAGTDTIDGGTAGIVLADGKSVCLARDSVTTTNWVTVARIA